MCKNLLPTRIKVKMMLRFFNPLDFMYQTSHMHHVLRPKVPSLTQIYVGREVKRTHTHTLSIYLFIFFDTQWYTTARDGVALKE